MRIVKCFNCETRLKKDWIGLNQKFFSEDVTDFYCIDCLSEILECDVDYLEETIRQFKQDGCKLFG